MNNVEDIIDTTIANTAIPSHGRYSEAGGVLYSLALNRETLTEILTREAERTTKRLYEEDEDEEDSQTNAAQEKYSHWYIDEEILTEEEKFMGWPPWV